MVQYLQDEIRGHQIAEQCKQLADKARKLLPYVKEQIAFYEKDYNDKLEDDSAPKEQVEEMGKVLDALKQWVKRIETDIVTLQSDALFNEARQKFQQNKPILIQPEIVPPKDIITAKS